MKTKPLKQGVLTEHSAGSGVATRKMVRERAVELAVINGRSAQAVAKSDWDQAKRELTGQPDVDPKTILLEAAPESERWDPLPGSTGHKVPATPSEDENDDGQSAGEKLVEAGLAEAEHDQMLQAARAAAKKELLVPPATTTLPPDPLREVSAQPDPAAKSLFDLISEQPFFEGLNPHQLQFLTDQALEMRFETGQELLHEGSPANRFFLILEGQVVLETELEERGTFPLETLGPGDDLGWSWLFPPYLLNVSARALTPTRTIFFYASRLREYCEQDHALGFQLMQRVAEVLIRRLEVTQRRLMECIVTNKLSNPIAP